MMQSIEDYRQLFIETNISNIKDPDFCFYSLLKDEIITKDTIDKFSLNFNNGMEVYYNKKLIQTLYQWNFSDMIEFKMLVAIHNLAFGKDEFETFLHHLKQDFEMCNEFICDLINSPFCNLRDLEFLFGRHKLCILLQNNNLGYTKFYQTELDEYKNYVNWEHLLKNRKDIDGDFLSRYRREIRDYIRINYHNSYYHEIKYISFWRCLNKYTSWKTIERYLIFYKYYQIFSKELIDKLTRNTEFPKDYYFEYFTKGNNVFEKFGNNINLEELKNNKHIPTSIIQNFIEKVKSGEMPKHKFNNYYYLTIQQFIELDQFYQSTKNQIFILKQNGINDPSLDLEDEKKKLRLKLDMEFRNDKFDFVTFGVYQFNKYRDFIEANSIIMEKFTNMLQTSSNGLEEFFHDYEIKD